MGAFFNLYDWSGTKDAVALTTSMSTIEGRAEDWRATSNSIVIGLGALFIPLLKLTTGGLCAVGAWHMWGARRGDLSTFEAAKKLALAGCGVAMILLFGGWIVIAETWFELWRSDALRDAALQSAFRYSGMITLIALFVGMKES